MGEPVTVEELAEAMYRMVKEAAGVRKVSATDLPKAMVEHFGAERCSKAACKEALRQLMDSGRCIYTYYGGASYVELPPQEGAAA
jgi:hypothetical protein